MPSRNAIKEYVPESFYHIYNRGVEKRKIFIDEADYATFLNLLKRYLSPASDSQVSDDMLQGRDGMTYYDQIELQSYCLMPNHFHLLLYVGDNPRAISELMRRVGTAYTMYFNKKYKRVGHLFQSRYKASRITNDTYLLYISRYIHRNPVDYKHWQWSSVHYFIGDWHAEWMRPDRTYKLYEWGTYESFLSDDSDFKQSLELIALDVADT